jgi:hypothetical protein
MRILVYNIRYATGTGPSFHLPVPGAGYLRSNRQALEDITAFIRREDPDVVGLVEVDTGSVRSGMINQAEYIGAAIGHYSTYECKYGTDSLSSMVPIVRKQANALLAAPRVHGQRFHYFDTGVKRLIIELELADAVVFLVHLSLKYRTRQEQLRFLHDLIRASTKPVILAGDFNTFFGEDEMFLFREAAGLRSANEGGLKTYPSHQPRMELDFILYGKGIEVDHFRIPQVRYSDHLPLVCDFHVKR